MSIDYDDFSKLDLRVAKILTVEKIPGKSRIVKGEIDLGEEKRNVIIGGAEFYEADYLIGKTVIAFINLMPKKIKITNIKKKQIEQINIPKYKKKAKENI